MKCFNCEKDIDPTNASTKESIRGFPQEVEETSNISISISVERGLKRTTSTFFRNGYPEVKNLMHSNPKMSIDETLFESHVELCLTCGKDKGIVWKTLMRACSQYHSNLVTDVIPADSEQGVEPDKDGGLFAHCIPNPTLFTFPVVVNPYDDSLKIAKPDDFAELVKREGGYSQSIKESIKGWFFPKKKGREG